MAEAVCMTDRLRRRCPVGGACQRVNRWQLAIFNMTTLFVTVLNNANITVQEFFQHCFK